MVIAQAYSGGTYEGGQYFIERHYPGVLVSAGAIPGLSVANMSGGNLDIDFATLPETMWPGSNLYPRPTAQFTLNIVSTSTDDDGRSGASDIIAIIEPTRGITRQGNYTTDSTHRGFCLGGSVELLKGGSERKHRRHE